MKLTRETIRSLGTHVEGLCKTFAEQNELAVNYAGASYEADGSSATLKFKFTAKVDGEVVPDHVRDWNRFHHLTGLKAEDLGRSFQQGRIVYTLIGLRSGRNLEAVVEADHNKKKYRMHVHQVVAALALLKV